MPLLKTKVAHKANTKILVGGETYEIDADCCVTVSDEHAEVLLQNDNWSVFDPNAAPAEKPKKAKGGIQLLDSAGEVVDTGEGDAPEEDTTTDDGESESGTEDAEPEGDAPEEDDGDPEVPGEGEPWPDPKEEYSRDWLEKCANAYQVKFNTRTKKATLVKRIMDAMYE